MARYHINPETGNIGVCSAKIKCNFDMSEEEHYGNKALALKAAEVKMAEKYETPTTGRLTKYSFVKEFKVLEENFNKDFDGIPTRFFKADLRGNKIMSRNLDLDKFNEISVEDKKAVLKLAYVDNQALAARLTSFTSSPKDLAMDDETVLKTAEEMGLTDIRKIENPKTLASLKSDRAWVATMGEKQIALTGSAVNSKNFASYRFRTKQEEFDSKKSFTYVDIRTLAGGKRILDKTDINVISEGVGENITTYDDRIDSKLVTLQALKELEDAQYEGSNFISQKKYLKESSGSVATAWEEKKDTDDVRKDMMKNSSLNKHFKKIDLDNDVDPDEFARFEADYEKVREHLPKFPKGMEPSLHIRKLGKHSSNSFHVHGLFHPAKNAIALDLSDGGSSSFIHENVHQWDLVSKNNISLSPEFRDLAKEYTKTIKMPPGMENKSEYYSTSTEVAARMGEIFLHSKIGDDTMLLDSKKFENFDYAPVMNNPELKAKVFSFFEKHMK